MKKVDIFTICLVTIVISFSFFSLQDNKVLGQTSNSSGSLSSSGESSSTSSSSSGSTVVLSDKFSGMWSARVSRTVIVNGVVVKEGSREIKLKLCVKDGVIKGLVVHPGFFTKALITSQNVISENEVDVMFKDKKGRTGTLRLTLIGNIQLNGDFSNGVSFEARKLHAFKLCEAFRKCDINDLFHGFDEN